MFRHYVAMSSFGSHSEKGTWLYSNFSDISRIKLFATGQPKKRRHVEICTTYTDKNGVKRCSGGKDLKASQTYTPAFGQAVYKLHKSVHAAALRRDSELVEAAASVDVTNELNLGNLSAAAMWPDAELGSILNIWALKGSFANSRLPM